MVHDQDGITHMRNAAPSHLPACSRKIVNIERLLREACKKRIIYGLEGMAINIAAATGVDMRPGSYKLPRRSFAESRRRRR